MKAKLVKEGLVLISESVEDDLTIWKFFDNGIVLKGKAVHGGKKVRTLGSNYYCKAVCFQKGRTKKLTKFE